jgi:hypothetical protein
MADCAIGTAVVPAAVRQANASLQHFGEYRVIHARVERLQPAQVRCFAHGGEEGAGTRLIDVTAVEGHLDACDRRLVEASFRIGGQMDPADVAFAVARMRFHATVGFGGKVFCDEYASHVDVAAAKVTKERARQLRAMDEPAILAASRAGPRLADGRTVRGGHRILCAILARPLIHRIRRHHAPQHARTRASPHRPSLRHT